MCVCVCMFICKYIIINKLIVTGIHVEVISVKIGSCNSSVFNCEQSRKLKPSPYQPL